MIGEANYSFRELYPNWDSKDFSQKVSETVEEKAITTEEESPIDKLEKFNITKWIILFFVGIVLYNVISK